MSEKKYAKGFYPNEKKSEYGNFFAIDIKADEFIKFVNENTNDKGYCKLNVYKAKEGGNGKNTHYAVLNDYVQKAKEENKIADNSDDLPF